jgi:hypothetical protein
MTQRRAGIIRVTVDGELQDAKGEFTVGFGTPKRTAVIGSSGVQGFTEEPQVAFIEGALTDRGNMNLKALFELDDASATVEWANGKTFVLRNAWYAGDGTVTSGEAEIPFRMEGPSGEEF